MIHVKGFPTICETFGGWLQLTSRFHQCYWAHGSVATFCSKSTLDLLVFQLQCYTGLMRCFERIYRIDPEFFGPFLPTFAGDIKRDITVFSKQKKTFIVYCFLVSLIRNQYKWCLQVSSSCLRQGHGNLCSTVPFSAATSSPDIQQLGWSKSRNAKCYNAKSSRNKNKNKNTQQFTQSSLSCIKLYLMTMNQTENPWVLCFCSASLPQPNLGERFPIGFSCFFFSKTSTVAKLKLGSKSVSFKLLSVLKLEGFFLQGGPTKMATHIVDRCCFPAQSWWCRVHNFIASIASIFTLKIGIMRCIFRECFGLLCDAMQRWKMLKDVHWVWCFQRFSFEFYSHEQVY